MTKTRDRVSDVKPYVERAIKDEQLRDDLKNAFTAARDVYDELMGGRSMTRVATRVATDKEIQDNLKSAIDDLRSAANRVQGREGHTTRNTMLLITGIALGILFNPMTGADTRKWLRERLFGESDEFGYQSQPNNQ